MSTAHRPPQIPFYRGYFENWKGPGTSVHSSQSFLINSFFVMLHKLATFHHQTKGFSKDFVIPRWRHEEIIREFAEHSPVGWGQSPGGGQRGKAPGNWDYLGFENLLLSLKISHLLSIITLPFRGAFYLSISFFLDQIDCKKEKKNSNDKLSFQNSI